jgi:hypothetical protein
MWQAQRVAPDDVERADDQCERCDAEQRCTGDGGYDGSATGRIDGVGCSD